MFNDRLRITGMFILSVILVLTGSFVRARIGDDVDTADWLIFTQVGFCVLGGFVGLLLMKRCGAGGFGTRAFIAYMLGVIVSGAFSAYVRFVFGYWLLLAGTGLLLAGLVSSSPSPESLGRLEKLILLTLAAMLLKDTIIDVFLRDVFLQEVVLREDYAGEELHRLGTGMTSANSMAMSAALAFWMSFGRRSKGFAHASWHWLWRGLFIAVILLARSRVALIGILAGSILSPWFAWRPSPAMNSHTLRLAIPCFIGSIAIATALAWVM